MLGERSLDSLQRGYASHRTTIICCSRYLIALSASSRRRGMLRGMLGLPDPLIASMTAYGSPPTALNASLYQPYFVRVGPGTRFLRCEACNVCVITAGVGRSKDCIGPRQQLCQSHSPPPHPRPPDQSRLPYLLDELEDLRCGLRRHCFGQTCCRIYLTCSPTFLLSPQAGLYGAL